MAVSTFKYATTTDLQRVFSRIGDYDTKQPIYNFQATDTSNQYQANNTGNIDQLYFDGIEGTSVSDSPNADYEYNYSSGTDSVQVFHSSKDPNDMSMEAGVDFATLIDDVLENASQELNTMIDARYPVPIPKAFMYSADPSNDTPQYDPIIVRVACYIAAVNLIRSTDPMSEEADKFYELVTNPEGTGLLDEVNAGKRKLNFEVDKTDKSGNIIEVTRTGTMYLVETYGSYSGSMYDRIQCICTTAGVYGTAEITIKTIDGTNLYGTSQTGVVITGGLQPIVGGLYARWEGNSMSVSDRWDVEVRSSDLTETNSQVSNVDIRRGYGRNSKVNY